MEAAKLNFSGRCDLLGTQLQFQVQDVIADTSLRPARAQTLIAAGDVPLLLVNKVGRGAAVHLNGSFAILGERGQPGSRRGQGIGRRTADPIRGGTAHCH